MTTALRRRRRALALTLALAAGAGTFAVSNAAEAQVPDPGTGASAFKNCPADVAAPGQTINCIFIVFNRGDNPATVTALTETMPFPGGTVVNLTCTLADGTVIGVGGTLAPNTACGGTFQLTVPNNPALCSTGLVDAVTIALAYPGTTLTAGAFATETTAIVCPAAIEITKTADALSKVGDSVTYTFEICNVGDVTVNRGSVTDPLLGGDISASFPATLAPDACATVVRQRTVAAGDPDPLLNTVTAIYTSGSGIFQTSDTATASASTNLFQPAVMVTKTCTPDSVVVGGVVTCTIVVTNDSSDDAPGLINGTIVDTLTGDLLDAANTAVDSSNCTAALATDGTCTIVTERTVSAADPNPLVNTVTVHYNPQGFPNDISDMASDSVTVLAPAEITVEKTADALSKVGDAVTYTIEICNVGADITLNRDSVIDSLLGNIGASFPATLAPGACAEVELERTVAGGDPDPLVNTVTATYSALGSSDTATANASTNLFQPGVSVTKSCTPDSVDIGGVVTCTIVITNDSSDDAPNLINGTIVDTLTGNLLDATNTAIDSSNCTAILPTDGTCTIVTERTVSAADTNPLVNTVTVHYNPQGFPNDISDTASDSVTVNPPPGGEGCTPGFWKQEQHFDSWVGFAPDDSFEEVFDVDVTLRAGGKGTVDDPTLLDALNATGGGVNALARHAVAALLNASNTDVASDFTTAQVIALVQDAIETGDFETAHQLLAAANEQGCPLN